MNKMLLALALLAVPGLVGAEGMGLGARVSGGYGFSMNTVQTRQTASEDQSPGIPTSAEFMYAPTPGLSLSLGVFPVFMSRTHEYDYFISFPTTGVATQTDQVTFLPVLVSIYFDHAFGDKLDVFGGIGAGVVPATTINSTNDAFGNSSSQLDAGFAWRSVLGAEWLFNSHWGAGLAVQQLTFNQREFIGQQVPTTANFNQVAPMIFIDAKM